MSTKKGDLEMLTVKRSSIKGRLTMFSNYLSKLISKENISQQDSSELSLRFERLQSLFSQYEDLQLEIEALDPSDLEAELEVREEMESRFYLLMSQANITIEKCKPNVSENLDVGSQSHSCQCNAMNFRLPLIKINNFDGTIFKWLEFRDTFNSLIHNNDQIKNIHKFHYWNSYLEGEAAQVISNLEVTDTNYTEAWKLLCERYNNTKQLINNHLNALLNIEPVMRESSKSLRHVVDHVSKNLRALCTLGLSVTNWDPLIIHMIAVKLDNYTSIKWEEQKSSLNNDIPTLDDFFKFLKSRADILESINRNKSEKESQKKDIFHKMRAQKIPVKSYVVSAPELPRASVSSPPLESTHRGRSCVVCSGSHRVYECADFLAKTPEDRMSEAFRLKLCLNCLRKGHYQRQCKLSPCSTCKRQHNVLLHIEQNRQVANTLVNTAAMDTKCDEEEDMIANMSVSVKNHILLSTALVKLYNPATNKYITVRALLDSGSQTSIITTDVKNKLELASEPSRTNVVGIGNISFATVTERCYVKLQSNVNNYCEYMTCLVLPKIAANVPHVQLDISRLNIPKDLVLSDKTFFHSAPVQMLIGADHFWNLIENKQLSLGINGPVAISSKLGWLLAGPVPSCYFDSVKQREYVNSVQCNHMSIDEDNLNDMLSKFWDIEKVPELGKDLSDIEVQCEQHYVDNTYRTDEGRFCVRLPLLTTPDCLGDSYSIAKNRFLSLERRLDKNPDLKRQYIEFIHEYADLGHLSDSAELTPANSYFVPHHAVVKPSSESTKLRVVFNASAPTTSGYSVNDIQMVGPTIQDSLFNIVLRFRMYKYVLSGDVEKMYRQILVNEKDRNLQLILWRDDKNDRLRTLRLNTVTYGFSSASFLSTRCLSQLGSDCKDRKIAIIIQKDFLVDDLLTGSDSEEELFYIKGSVEQALASGCFKLRKYRSNLSSILGNESKSEDNLIISTSSHILGVGWNPREDYINFPTSYKSDNNFPTKRSILSQSCKIFDPLGLLSLVTIVPKIIIQKLWIAKVEWDDPVPDDIRHAWESFENNITHLGTLRIPRNVLGDCTAYTEIHCFCDASQVAYATCIYIRSISDQGQVTVRLLCAKARVSPIKPTTIPRLELCAALLGAQLTTAVCHAMRKNIERKFYWSDSTIVLAWLRMEPSKLKTFVANRVGNIKELTNGADWNHIPSTLNPADLASRGVEARELSDLDLWWNGPSFLRDSSWSQFKYNIDEDIPEMKVNLVGACSEGSNQTLIHFEKYSNMNRLQRMFAYVLRFIYNCRNHSTKLTGVLQPDELNLAFLGLVRLAQKDCFTDEIQIISSGKFLSSKNHISPLSPFLDDNNILRVGGRLNSSSYTYEKCHPVLLHSKHTLTKLLFRREHIRLLHAGPQLLLATIRESVWPIAGRDLARKTVRDCVVCRRFTGKGLTPLMGSLPSQRTTPDYPFISVGIDFAGPFLITDRKGRGCKITKCYMCIFVCMRYKCLHLEAVSELSKGAFVLALRRFISRRGKPLDIFCDNGRNFVAASKELGNFIASASDSITDFASGEGIKFHFSPAYAPHFGGLWEAGVKSAKYHLKRILGNTHLTFECLSSIFCQIEAILNSRPLYPMSSSPNDLLPLSPGHFIIGRALTSLPSPCLNDKNYNRLDSFQKLEYLRQQFWRRWSLEYISELQQRIKWRLPDRQLQLGDLVLIKEENTAPMHWRLGRVSKLFPGADGVARVADVTTPTGSYRRCAKSLCPLLDMDLEPQGCQGREYVCAGNTLARRGLNPAHH